MPSSAGRNAELLLSSGGVKRQGGISHAVEATVADSPLPRRDPPAPRRPRRVNILGVAPIGGIQNVVATIVIAAVWQLRLSAVIERRYNEGSPFTASCNPR